MSRTPLCRPHESTGTGRAGARHEHVALPVVLLAALDAAGIQVEDLLTRLLRGSMWQDQAIRSADGGMVVEAFRSADALRCFILVGPFAWYHNAVDMFCGHRAGTL
ncbi:hypothetical protein [Sphingomonas sp. PAMC 26621]|uniref:hypothetical protein n=1 Tax=Sphingomonas sp. PAMC 26621 TaxID=1112213 RepID=UPI000474763B|nr:hypothetical protein [Sphingomonas sp. PAMC 26621]